MKPFFIGKKNDKKSDDIAEYNRVRMAQVNQNCESAAIDYFNLIAQLCYTRTNIMHSLMRIAIRPIFYLGITDVENVIMYIKHINTGKADFLQWLETYTDDIENIVRELTICCFFYDMTYREVESCNT